MNCGIVDHQKHILCVLLNLSLIKSRLESFRLILNLLSRDVLFGSFLLQLKKEIRVLT